MAISTNIGLENVTSNQTSPEVPVNSALNKVDDSINSDLSKTFADADITLTDAEFLENGLHLVSGTVTATRNYIVPTSFTLGSDSITVKKFFVVHNTVTGGDIVVKTSGGTGITLTNGDKKLLYADGTNVIAAL